MDTDAERKRDSESYAVIGAAMEVHHEMGFGLTEPVYQDAMAVEMAARGVPFEREKVLPVRYKGGILPTGYRVDFLCYGALLVECKALKAIGQAEEAQVLNYLRVTRHERALLLNFGGRLLGFRRLVHSSEESAGDDDSVDSFRL